MGDFVIINAPEDVEEPFYIAQVHLRHNFKV
jgi:hypothetical protein